MKYLKWFMAPCLCFLPMLQAQDIQYSQYYATNIALNPAFTGATKYARATLSQRSQWPTAAGYIYSYLVGFDRYFYYQNLGLGGLAQYDRLAGGVMNNIRIGPTASYLIFNEKDKFLRLGMGLFLANKAYRTSSLVFSDQLDPDFGQILSQSADIHANNINSKTYLDVDLGGLYNTPHFWFGIAGSHINTPNISVISAATEKTPMKLGIHTGYKLEFRDTRGLISQVERSMSFTLNFKHQKNNNQLDVGTYFVFDPITFGLWYRGLPVVSKFSGIKNQDAVIPMFGLKTNGFRLAYSFDITISKLGMQTGGTHEFSLVWEYGDVSDKRRKKPGKMKTMYMPYPKL